MLPMCVHLLVTAGCLVGKIFALAGCCRWFCGDMAAWWARTLLKGLYQSTAGCLVGGVRLPARYGWLAQVRRRGGEHNLSGGVSGIVTFQLNEYSLSWSKWNVIRWKRSLYQVPFYQYHHLDIFLFLTTLLLLCLAATFFFWRMVFRWLGSHLKMVL